MFGSKLACPSLQLEGNKVADNSLTYWLCSLVSKEAAAAFKSDTLNWETQGKP